MSKPLKAFAILIASAIVGCTNSTGDNGFSIKDPNKELTSLADDYYREYLLRSPYTGTYRGLPSSPNDQLEDNSLVALAEWRSKEDVWISRVKKLKKHTSDIKDIALLGLLEQTLSTSIDKRVCKTELWKFSHFGGWHSDITGLIEYQPIKTAEDQKKAIQRYSGLPAFVETEIANMKLGLSKGYSTPKALVDIVIKDIDKLLSSEEDKSPLFVISRNTDNKKFGENWKKLVADKIKPSYQKYYEFLKHEYLPKAREKIGLGALPNNDGLACYLAHIKQSTTLDMSIEELRKAGQDFESEVRPEFLKQIKKVFNANNYDELYENTSGKEYYFQSEKEFLSAGKEHMEQLKSAAGNWFADLPKTEVIFESTPEQYVSGPGARYLKGTADGNTPAKVWITFGEPGEYAKRDLANLIAHEGIPGHHMQHGTAADTTETHPLSNLLRFAAFSEGWAIYGEMLAQEAGVFSEVDRISFLEGRESNFERVQIDLGIHFDGWTREEAIKWQKDRDWSTTAARINADRLTAMPAQTMSYLYGSLEIKRLRKQAEKELGPNFDIKEFHDQVLKNGNVPMNTLREVINRWLVSKKK